MQAFTIFTLLMTPPPVRGERPQQADHAWWTAGHSLALLRRYLCVRYGIGC